MAVTRPARSAAGPRTGSDADDRAPTTASRSTRSRARSAGRRTSRSSAGSPRVTDVVLAIGTGVATEALRRGLARPESLRTVPPVVDGRVVEQTPATPGGGPRAARSPAGRPGGRHRRPAGLPEGARALRRRRRRAAAHGRGRRCGSAAGPLLDDGTARRSPAAGLGDRMRFVGERRDVPDLLPAFDVFAMSSRYEGLPCAVVEAMRCGLPVVATAVNSVPDLVVPGVSGVLVPPARPADLAAAARRPARRPRHRATPRPRGPAAGRRIVRRLRTVDRPRPGVLRILAADLS